MTTNPERLWAFAKTYGGEDYVGIFAETEESVAEGERASHDDDEHCAPVTAYVREDVAEAETTALRRERDALRLHLRAVLAAWGHEASQGDGLLDEHVPVYEAARAAAAGTGVG